MLNPNLKLNEKLWDKPEEVPIRKGFGEGLLSLGEEDERVVGLCADLTETTQMHMFRDKFPNRFVQIGVAEQNLASVASGLSAMGKVPFISSYAMFSPGRNWEQIRTTICYNNRAVIIAGSHAGVSVGPDGGTHQAIEDIAIMRAIPRMVVISPCDAIEAKKATIEAGKLGLPVYLRLAREKTPVMTTLKTPFKIGRAETFFTSEKPQVSIIATGALLHEALKAAKKLLEDKIEVEVLNLHTIKPLDTEAIQNLAKRVGRIVTVEEHQVFGGMGSAVSEFLAENHPVPIEFVGVRDEFGQSGTPDELIKHFGLDAEGIMKAVKRALSR